MKKYIKALTSVVTSGLTRQELLCVVTRNETLSGYRNCITVYAGLTGWRRGCEGCKGELLSCFLNDNLMQFLHNKILKLRINIDLFLRLWQRIWGVGQLNRAIKRSTRTAWKYEPVPPCNVLIKKFWITILFNVTSYLLGFRIHKQLCPFPVQHCRCQSLQKVSSHLRWQGRRKGRWTICTRWGGPPSIGSPVRRPPQGSIIEDELYC